MNTIKDVARLAGTSVSTVSRAFRDNCYINKKTKQKVLEAAKQLEYCPNMNARGLKSNKNNLIGLIIPNVKNLFFADIVHTLENILKEKGYRLMITFSNSSAKEEGKCLQTMMESRVAGLITVPLSYQFKRQYEYFLKNNIPVIQCFSRQYADLYTVKVNDQEAMYQAALQLLKNGHRKILLPEYTFNMDSYSHPMTDKFIGFQQAMGEYDIKINEADCYFLTHEGDIKEALRQRLLEFQPTAFLGTNSRISILGMGLFQELGLSIPRDISFIAYDDNEWLSLLGYGAVTHPMKEIGQTIAETILEMVQEQQSREPRLIEFSSILNPRNSVRNINNKC